MKKHSPNTFEQEIEMFNFRAEYAQWRVENRLVPSREQALALERMTYEKTFSQSGEASC